jgi:hypothetical protein
MKNRGFTMASVAYTSNIRPRRVTFDGKKAARRR